MASALREVAATLGSDTPYRFDYAAGADLNANLLAAVDRHGFAVLERAVPAASCARVVADMRPFLNATPHGLHGLGGTRRCGALVARSPASHEMIAQPAILALVKSILGEQRLSGDAVQINGRAGKGEKGFRYPWHLHLTQVIDLGPGAGSEAMPHQLKMHRANGMWLHDFRDSALDLQVEVMWALTDFTLENGATHVVPGSHRERGAHRAQAPAVQVAMPQGSALIWTGWTTHGAGVNASAAHRIGMNINYALGFLVQEENQFLACPPHLARRLPVQMQRLIGYRQPSGSLNYVAECQSPADSVLREDFDVLVPGAHGHPMDPRIDGPAFAPADDSAFQRQLERLEAQKAEAIADDDLERALHCKNAISVLKRSPRL